MPLKRQDGTFESKPTNYDRDSRTAGINFQISRTHQLFAPYSFLSHAEMKGEGEIIFHYTFGVVRVTGDHLGYIYSLVLGHELSCINCAPNEAAKPDDPRVKEIVFEKSGDNQDIM
jgi:hypothetical protein